ncbi:MAG: PleD family two-component response regulator [Candidatus Paceibacteria bacterium]|jgi:PleD family two-component response regulator
MEKKILIIEDDSMLRSALAEWLSGEGYEVRGCSSVVEAFEQIEETKPDVILTDLVMANHNGFDVLKKVKEDARLNSIIVLVMSNSSQDKDFEKAILMGAKDFFSKSDLSLKEIVDRVKKVISETEPPSAALE